MWTTSGSSFPVAGSGWGRDLSDFTVKIASTMSLWGERLDNIPFSLSFLFSSLFVSVLSVFSLLPSVQLSVTLSVFMFLYVVPIFLPNHKVPSLRYYSLQISKQGPKNILAKTLKPLQIQFNPPLLHNLKCIFSINYLKNKLKPFLNQFSLTKNCLQSFIREQVQKEKLRSKAEPYPTQQKAEIGMQKVLLMLITMV